MRWVAWVCTLQDTGTGVPFKWVRAGPAAQVDSPQKRGGSKLSRPGIGRKGAH